MTRRQQFIERQERFQRRRENMYNRGWHHEFIDVPNDRGYPYWQRTTRAVALWFGPKQMPTRTGPGIPRVFLDVAPLGPPITFTISEPARATPPHVTLTGFWGNYVHFVLEYNLRLHFVWYHRRRMRRIGHKPERMNGFQRRCWGAAFQAYSNGVFPDWDPLHRHPNQADIDNGDPSYDGPFPQTPPA